MVWCSSALQRVEIFDFDAAALAKHHDQDREADGGFGGGYGQYEEHENLAADVAQIAGKRDEVEIDGKQHELDAHQEHDDVLAVQEHAGDRNREQNPGQCQHVGERDHGLFSEAILTIRTRSLALAATWSAMFCGLPPLRRRKVSTMAATLATSRMTAAICAG